MTKLFPLILLISLQLKANYIKYYQLINKAEETFVTLKNKECFKYYDSAFTIKNKPFVKDAYIAAEIAFYLKDSGLFIKYLNLGFKNGLPLSAVPSAPILRNIKKFPIYQTIQINYNKYKKNEVDFNVRENILKMCFEGDSIKLFMGTDTNKVRAFYRSENKFRDYLNKNFLSKGTFPNEHLIGIATDSMYSNFLKRHLKKDIFNDVSPFGQIPEDLKEKSEYDLVSKYALSVLIHSRCSFPKFKEKLWQAVLSGYMHPKEYGFLHETSITWNKNTFNEWDKCEAQKQKVYYNIQGFNPMDTEQTYVSSEKDIVIVEENRAKVFMQKFWVDKQKKKMETETGMRFFFGFANAI